MAVIYIYLSVISPIMGFSNINTHDTTNVAGGGHKEKRTLLETFSNSCGDHLADVTSDRFIFTIIFIFGVLAWKISHYYESMGLFENFITISSSFWILFSVVITIFLFLFWSIEYFSNKNQVSMMPRNFIFVFNLFYSFYDLFLDIFIFLLREDAWSLQIAPSLGSILDSNILESQNWTSDNEKIAMPAIYSNNNGQIAQPWADGAQQQEEVTCREMKWQQCRADLLSRKPVQLGGGEELDWKKEVRKAWEAHGQHGLLGGMKQREKQRPQKGFGDARKVAGQEAENNSNTG